jgi:hypothetical protein
MPANLPSEYWEAVASSADGSKLIVGCQQFIYCISTNSGFTWTTKAEPQTGSGYGSWYCIASSADGTKYVAINYNGIWVSTNSGTTWLSNNVPGASFLAFAALSADGNKLVVVDGKSTSPGQIYTSTNWGVTVTPTTAPASHWVSVAASADGTKLVAAGTIYSQNVGFIYTSTNSGLTWTLTGAPANQFWAAVASSADGSKLVAASGASFGSNQPNGGIFTSTDFGMTWTSNSVPPAQWESVASSADGTRLLAVAIEPVGLIYTSTNSGITWVSNSVPAYGWFSVASSADGGTLIAAAIVDQSFNPGYIYTSWPTPSPQLRISPANPDLKLSWIVPSRNFVLQQNSDLTTTKWMAVTNALVPNLTNLQYEVVLPPTNNRGFYRLKTH